MEPTVTEVMGPSDGSPSPSWSPFFQPGHHRQDTSVAPLPFAGPLDVRYNYPPRGTGQGLARSARCSWNGAAQAGRGERRAEGGTRPLASIRSELAPRHTSPLSGPLTSIPAGQLRQSLPTHQSHHATDVLVPVAHRHQPQGSSTTDLYDWGNAVSDSHSTQLVGRRATLQQHTAVDATVARGHIPTHST